MSRSRIVFLANGKNRYEIDGKEVTAEEYAKEHPSKLDELLASGTTLPSHTKTCWPMKSESLAVHPKQVEQANERNKRHGVNVRYDSEGLAILPDRGARRDLLRLEGFHDKRGGYGD